jgi:hypothetical protein
MALVQDCTAPHIEKEEEKAVKRSEEECTEVSRCAPCKPRRVKGPRGTGRSRLETRELFDCNLAICFLRQPTPHLASPASPGMSESPPIAEPQLSMNGGVQQLACVEKMHPPPHCLICLLVSCLCSISDHFTFCILPQLGDIYLLATLDAPLRHKRHFPMILSALPTPLLLIEISLRFILLQTKEPQVACMKDWPWSV